MFNVKVSYGSGQSCSISTNVLVDTLSDAEQEVTNMLKGVFPDTDFLLVHVGDLVYEVYPIDEPIATVHIRTAG